MAPALKVISLAVSLHTSSPKERLTISGVKKAAGLIKIITINRNRSSRRIKA
ncbi:hypothetical protein D3C71_2128600 [compost metagenome]